jgi:hypothetical protein
MGFGGPRRDEVPTPGAVDLLISYEKIDNADGRSAAEQF